MNEEIEISKLIALWYWRGRLQRNVEIWAENNSRPQMLDGLPSKELQDRIKSAEKAAQQMKEGDWRNFLSYAREYLQKS